MPISMFYFDNQTAVLKALAVLLFLWWSIAFEHQIAAGVAVCGAVLLAGAKLYREVCDRRIGERLLAEAAKHTGPFPNNVVDTRLGKVKYLADGSAAWYSRGRFGLVPADGASADSQLQSKVRTLVRIGNNVPSCGYSPEEINKTNHVKDIFFRNDTEEVLAQIPTGCRYLGSGNSALALRTRAGTALRIETRGQTPRVDDPDMLPALKTHLGDDWQVEELSLAKKRGIGKKEIKELASRVRARGLVVYDCHSGNVGRNAKGRVVFLDPGCIDTAP